MEREYEATTSEMNLLCTKLVAEKCIDKQDVVLSKQVRKLYEEFFLVDIY